MILVWVRRHRLVTVLGIVAAVAFVGVTAFALVGGFDATTTTRVSGNGIQVVRVALVDRAVGYDVTPDVVDVAAGTHVVLEVVNEARDAHDLAVAGGPRTAVLGPGETERLDLGEIRADGTGRCTIGDHDIAGMSLTLDVA